MIRAFRLLLLAVIGLYGTMLSDLTFGQIYLWNADNPRLDDLVSSPTWQYTSRIGPVKLRKDYSKDPLAQAGIMSHSIIIAGVSADSLENGKAYVLNKDNKKVYMEQDLRGDTVQLPINATTYSSLKLTSVILLVIAFTILFWISVLIYRFTRSALQNDFFTVSNMRKLQTIGWIITLYGILSWLCTITMPFIIQLFLHYKNISSDLHSGIYVFPTWLITGMLILLVAKAFENGIILKEDNNSIV